MIKVDKLRLSLGDRLLFENLSFDLHRPAFVAVIGLNGAGKTSLLKSFVNLLPYQGEIFLSSPPAYLSQRNSISFDIKASDLVVMGKYATKKFMEPYSKEDYVETYSVFEKLSIAPLYNRMFTELSGGEQQLVWLAQVLLQNRPILLLDEPTQYLDLLHKKRFFEVVKTLVAVEGKFIFCVTHDVHHLYSLQEDAFLLNLSSPSPTLQNLTKESLDRELSFLEGL